MSLLLRKLLARFLTLPVGDAEPAADAGGDAAPAEAGTGDETLDDLLASTDVDDVSRGTTEAPADDPVKAARADADRYRREAEAERAARTALEQRQPVAALPGQDPVYAAEEKRLADARAAGMSANDLHWLEWQITVDRRNRTTQQNADRALSEARDLADRTAYGRLEITKPAVFKRYNARVEQEMARLQKSGQNAPREAVLAFLIGQDVLKGDVKKKVAPKANPDAQAPGTVDRGRTPGARTDVSGRAGGKSEREARRARLAGVPL